VALGRRGLTALRRLRVPGDPLRLRQRGGVAPGRRNWNPDDDRGIDVSRLGPRSLERWWLVKALVSCAPCVVA